jgi:hypothetical protein|tara:strand:- start:642 stop:842 length:201 start_codon:yes stop_codon:yes gene_type:complete
MSKILGNKDFYIMEIRTDTGYMLRIKATPLILYLERNKEEDDNRLQFGIGLFKYRLGIALDKSIIN